MRRMASFVIVAAMAAAAFRAYGQGGRRGGSLDPIVGVYQRPEAPGDQLSLNLNGTFSLAQAGKNYQGTFRTAGDKLILNFGNKRTSTGTLQGSSITDNQGLTWIKQNATQVPPDASSNGQPGAPQAQPARTPQSQDTLRNEDVVKMVKAGLDDAIIIAKIRTSTCQFDTTPDTLIGLKQSGVTPTVLGAMMGAASGPQTQVRVQVPSGSGNLPTSYGYFLFDGAQYQSLTPTRVSVVVGLSVRASGVGSAVDGFKGDAAQAFAVDVPAFVVYQQNVDINAFHLAKLEFVRNMQAGQFNMQSTQPQFFPNVYGVDYNQIVPVNLWRPQQQEIPMRIEPVAERNGMFRLAPEGALSPGKYALFSGQTIHASGMIFAARLGSNGDSALYFEIRPAAK